MTESKRQLRVFLCHASADKPKVRELYLYLKKRGITPWLDAEDLIPGQRWQVEIPKALNTSDAIIICLTKNSVDKEGYVQKEIKFALDKALEMPEGRIFLIPARLEDCEVPYSLKDYQWVNLFETEGYSKLMKALKVRASQLQSVTFELPQEGKKYETKALEPEKDVHPSAPTQKILKPKGWASRKSTTAIMSGLLLLCIGGICATTVLPRLFPNQFAKPSKTSTKELYLPTYPIVVQSKTLQPTQMPTEIIPATATSFPSEVKDSFGLTMMFVSEGEFKMGSEIKDAIRACQEIQKFVPTSCMDYYFSDEEPPHYVQLDSYYIDKYEVTNQSFTQFLNAIGGELTIELDSGSLDTYGLVKYRNNYVFDSYTGWNSERDRIKWKGNEFEIVAGFEEHPVTFVSWFGASAYCEWRGARLPTEAEWEKAARGVDGRSFPWGNEIDCDKANYSYSVPAEMHVSGVAECVGDTSPVGSYENGGSPYGVFDMAGNVWEWVSDWYSEKYYTESTIQNPLGPSSGEMKVSRGGSFVSYTNAYVFSSFRSSVAPTRLDFDMGFRCAKDANP